MASFAPAVVFVAAPVSPARTLTASFVKSASVAAVLYSWHD